MEQPGGKCGSVKMWKYENETAEQPIQLTGTGPDSFEKAQRHGGAA